MPQLPDGPDMITYDPAKCAVFFRSRERHGAWSNMSGGFQITVNGAVWNSSEALYQACRYPDNDKAQINIFESSNGFGAKIAAKQHFSDTRPDWDEVRELIMEWVVRLKIEQYGEAMRREMEDTEGKPIVERSGKDNFWGAMPHDGGKLRGYNRIGILCTRLRDEFMQNQWVPAYFLTRRIPNLKLFGQMVEI